MRQRLHHMLFDHALGDAGSRRGDLAVIYPSILCSRKTSAAARRQFVDRAREQRRDAALCSSACSCDGAWLAASSRLGSSEPAAGHAARRRAAGPARCCRRRGTDRRADCRARAPSPGAAAADRCRAGHLRRAAPTPSGGVRYRSTPRNGDQQAKQRGPIVFGHDPSGVQHFEGTGVTARTGAGQRLTPIKNHSQLRRGPNPSFAPDRMSGRHLMGRRGMV